MRTVNIKTQIEVYPDSLSLSLTEQKLIEKAKFQIGLAYAPYSKFQVGAAVLLENGAIIGGSNMENAAYPMCVCAEPASLAAAASSYPNVPVKAIAIATQHPTIRSTKPAAPCGSCRQILSEAEDRYGQHISILLLSNTGEVYKLKSAKDLLPLSFGGEYL